MKKKLIILLALLLVIVIGGISVYYLTQGNEIDENSKKYEVNMKRPEEWAENRIAIPGYGDIHMLEDSDVFNVALFNPQDNPCYFKFTVILNESEKILYESGLVPPGEAITNAKLNQQIKVGTYSITIRIQTFDLKDKKTEMNGSEIKTKIVTN